MVNRFEFLCLPSKPPTLQEEVPDRRDLRSQGISLPVKLNFNNYGLLIGWILGITMLVTAAKVELEHLQLLALLSNEGKVQFENLKVAYENL